MSLERYKNKDDAFVKKHRSSQKFQEFRAKMAAMQESKKITKVDGHSYIETDLGFV